MNVNDDIVLRFLRRSMIARIATLSQNGRPSVNPLYFIHIDRKIWLGTPEWTLAVRNIKADPRVSLLFDVEKNPAEERILRVCGKASVRTDRKAMRSYRLRILFKVLLLPGNIINWLSHPRQLWLRRYYTAQSAQKGRTCVIEVAPGSIELLMKP
jgi:nitroimidazol reductase NimA-like FMN-containing flavoprotein (pyridoxamine 5'-phosphate oxidase superfamily)